MCSISKPIGHPLCARATEYASVQNWARLWRQLENMFLSGTTLQFALLGELPFRAKESEVLQAGAIVLQRVVLAWSARGSQVGRSPLYTNPESLGGVSGGKR